MLWVVPGTAPDLVTDEHRVDRFRGNDFPGRAAAGGQAGELRTHLLVTRKTLF